MNRLFRTSISLVLAAVAAQITFIPFAFFSYFGKLFPNWLQASSLIVGFSLALLVGYKCFKWIFRYFGGL